MDKTVYFLTAHRWFNASYKLCKSIARREVLLYGGWDTRVLLFNYFLKENTKNQKKNVLGNLTIDNWKIRQFGSMNH
jgi:hypothetical protein